MAKETKEKIEELEETKEEVKEEVKEEPVPEKKKGKNKTAIILGVIIIILLFIVGILAGYTYQKNNSSSNKTEEKIDNKDEKSKKDKEEKESEEKKEEKKEEPKKDDSRKEEPKKEEKPSTPEEPDYSGKRIVKHKTGLKPYEEAQSLIPFNLCGAPEVPLEKKSLTIRDLSSDLKGKMIISSYGPLGEDDIVYLTEEEMSKYFEDLSFLRKLRDSKDNQYSLTASMLSFKNGKYVIETYATGCEGVREGKSLEYVDYSINGNTLTLRYAYYWVSFSYDEKNDMYYYEYRKDKDGKVIYDKVNAMADEPLYNGKKITYEQFDKYNFVFDISHNNIRLTNINYEAVQ